MFTGLNSLWVQTSLPGRDMTSRMYFVLVLLASAFMTLNSLYAQRRIDSITIDQAVPGQISVLTVTGKGFDGVTHVDVQVDDIDADVKNFTIVSDTELKITIQFPRTGRTGRRHRFAVKVAGEGTAEALQPRAVISIESPPIEPAVIPSSAQSDPEITLALDGEPITDDSLVINFKAAISDSASRTLVVRNVGQTRLLLSNLQTPSAFEVVGFPDQLQPDSSAAITIRFLPRSQMNTTGVMNFNTNVPGRSQFSLQLTGSILPSTTPTSVISPFGGSKKLFYIIPIIVTFVVALIVIRRVVAGKRIRIKPVRDLGKQAITSTGMIKSSFELSLTPSLDFGKSEIRTNERLIKRESS